MGRVEPLPVILWLKEGLPPTYRILPSMKGGYSILKFYFYKVEHGVYSILNPCRRICLLSEMRVLKAGEHAYPLMVGVLGALKDSLSQ